VHSRMAFLSSASTWMAPRMARTVTCSTPYDLHLKATAGGGVAR
jgi:hypothetical protein